MSELANVKASIVDLSIESFNDLWYGFGNVPMPNLVSAVEKAKQNKTVFSVVNTEGAAIAIPMHALRSISVADVDEEVDTDGDETDEELDALRTWTLVMENIPEDLTQPTQVFPA